MEKCFVIQPFDKDTFDKRFEDTFKPAIEKAGLEAYRIDLDPSVIVPIDAIEKGIRDCSICFAEITSDNPNVWYELGYAFACKRDVVLVCSDERTGKFPFDIQHRHVIQYSTKSASDYSNLAGKITEKILAIKKTAATVQTLHEVPIVQTEGLANHEFAIVVLIGEQQIVENEYVAVNTLKGDMARAGYADIATSLGLKTLRNLGMAEIFNASDGGNYEGFSACRLTAKGEKWLLANQDKLMMRREQPKAVEESDMF
jgi:hypothetical protein